MNLRGLLLAASCLAGPALSPAAAQLIHISAHPRFADEATLTFKADSVPLDGSLGIITQLDFTYDSSARAGPLDPGRNNWHLKVYQTLLERSFEVTKPFQSVTVWDNGLNGMTFVYDHVNDHIELDLLFASPIPTDGRLPTFPLPPLGTFTIPENGQTIRSEFRLFGTLFGIPHQHEVYGGMTIDSITTTMTPIPESSLFSLGALTAAGVVIGLRQRRKKKDA